MTQQPYQQPYQQPAGQQPAPGQATEARAASILAHLSAPLAAFFSAGWLSVLGPLVVWMLYKDRDPVVRQAAAGAFNFNVAFWVVNVLSWLLIITLVGAVVGVPLLVISFLVAAWCHVHGAIRASNGQPYTYPFQLPVLR